LLAQEGKLVDYLQGLDLSSHVRIEKVRSKSKNCTGCKGEVKMSRNLGRRVANVVKLGHMKITRRDGPWGMRCSYGRRDRGGK